MYMPPSTTRSIAANSSRLIRRARRPKATYGTATWLIGPSRDLPHSPIIHGDRERIEKPGQPQALEREGEGEHRERRYLDRPVIEVRARREELLGQGGQRLPPPKEHVEGPAELPPGEVPGQPLYGPGGPPRGDLEDQQIGARLEDPRELPEGRPEQRFVLVDGLANQMVQGVEADDRVHRPRGEGQAGRRPVETYVDVRVMAQGLVRQIEADHEARRGPLVLEPGSA